MLGEVVVRGQAGFNGDGADRVGARRVDIIRMIANEPEPGMGLNPAAAASLCQRQAGERGARIAHLGEGAKAEVAAKARAFHLSPADEREVSGNQTGGD